VLHLKNCDPEQRPKEEGSKNLTQCEHEKLFFFWKTKISKQKASQFSTEYLAA